MMLSVILLKLHLMTGVNQDYSWTYRTYYARD